MTQFSPTSLILTANQRLAQVIRQQYDQQQTPLTVWESLTVLPLQSWLKNLWQTQDSNLERVLTPFQERELWAKIIKDSAQSHYPLLNVASTTLLVQQAWQWLNHWRINLVELKSLAATEETQLFISWAEAFLAECRAHQWISEALLPAQLQNLGIVATQTIILAGFDELPPAHQELMQSMSQLVTVTELPLRPPINEPAQFYQQSFANLEQEITEMAYWAKLKLQDDPHCRIGCVIPNFTEHREQVAYIFKQVFAENLSVFNIASGASLNSFAIIQAGLNALQLNFSALLQSPYLCQHEVDIHFGAMLDAECRRLGNFTLTLAALYAAMPRWQPTYPQQTWLTRLRAFETIHSQLDAASELKPSQWAQQFMLELNALGWPGGRNLDSQEYQLILRWQELCGEFLQLDEILGQVNRQQALASFQHLVSQTIFQPKTPAQANIQILGLLESSGFYFDAMWLMGMSQHHWPPPAKPNPFLPYSVQVAKQTPHCSAEREWHYALKITQRLWQSAPSIWLSCSTDEPDQPARFTRLIPQAQPADLNFSKTANPLLKLMAAGRTELLSEPYGPPITATEKIQGGSGILTKQAECPFRAFAVYRLQALGLAQPELGISQKKHGILVHSALEKLWAIFQNQQNLLQINPDQLTKHILTIIDECLAAELTAAEAVFAPIERHRLHSLLTEWFELEKQRPPFKILEQETAHAVTIAGLHLHLQIDRIDELADGSRLLIDYKTGETRIQNWLQDRLLQPQLPLYTVCTHSPSDFSGIAFAQLYVGKLSFNGLHAEYLPTDDYFPAGIINVADYKKDLTAPKTWQALLNRWQEILQKLAIDFQMGHAAVDPAEQGAPCKNCELTTLCRVK